MGEAVELDCDEHDKDIAKFFKPIFDKYGPRGMPMNVLRNDLETSGISQEKVSLFLYNSDMDGDKLITFQEFMRQIKREDHKFTHKLANANKYLNRAVLAIAPRHASMHQRKVMLEHGYDQYDSYNWGEAEVENYVEAYDCKPPPIFIPLITLVEIIVFIHAAVVNGIDDDPNNDVTAVSGVDKNSIFIYHPYKRHQAWRFFSYMLLHNGYIHLLFNCLVQILLGVLLELVHKFWRVGIVYFVGVIAGSLAHSVSDPFVLLVGASGGCYALIGAHLATVLMNWNTMQKGWTEDPINFLSSGVFRLIVIILLAGSDTGLSIYQRFNSPEKVARVGFAAHLGGFIAGLLIGIPVLRNLQVEKWEKVVFWISIVVVILLVGAAVMFNVFCHEQNMCPKVIW